MSSNYFKQFQTYVKKELTFLSNIVLNHPKLVLFAGVVLAGISLFYSIKHLAFLPNFAGLNKKEVSYSRNYDAFVKEFKVEPNIIVVAKGPNPKENIRFLSQLAQRLSGNPTLKRVYYKVDLRPFKAWAVAYPDYSTLQQIARAVKLAKPLFKSIDYRVDLTKFWLAIPKMSETQTNVQVDPGQILQLKQLVDFMNDKLNGKSGSLSPLDSTLKEIQNIQETQYITLKNGKYALLFARPSTNSKGEENLEASVQAIRQAAQEIKPLFPDVEAHLTGEPVLGADEMKTAKQDILWAGIVSLVLCSTLLIIGFSDFYKTLAAVATLLVGTGWSLGYITLTVKHLNVFTLSLFPMLIGLAIDLSIQFLGRYQEERERSSSPQEAIKITYFSTGTGLFAAALIIALGFLAISLSEYKGIAELGLAMGGSLLLCFFSTITILPALLVFGKTGKKTQHVSNTQAPRNAIQPMRLERTILNHAGIVLIIAFAISIPLAIKARSIRFDHNVLNLQAKGTDSINTELELLKVSDKSSLFAVIVADDPENAIRYTNQLQKLDTVGNLQSPLAFLPQEQAKKLPVLQDIKKELTGFRLEKPSDPVSVPQLILALENIRKMIDDAQKKIALASGTLQLFQSFLFPGSQIIPHRSLSTKLAGMNATLGSLKESVVRFIHSLKAIGPEKASEILTRFQASLSDDLQKSFLLIKGGIPEREIKLGDLPLEVRNQFVGKTGKIMIQVYPSQNIWERPALEHFVAELRQVSPNVTGSPILIFETTRVMLESYQQAAKIAFVVILVVAFIQFRQIKLTLFTLAPLGVGLVWLMGIMVLFHKSFNPASLLTLPIILGIGVAFGVYVVNRYREEQHPSIFSTSTGRSVLLSALTTIAGFASLLGVHHQGLQSLGFTMTVGLSAITIQALVVLPSLLEVIENYPASRREKKLRQEVALKG